MQQNSTRLLQSNRAKNKILIKLTSYNPKLLQSEIVTWWESGLLVNSLQISSQYKFLLRGSYSKYSSSQFHFCSPRQVRIQRSAVVDRQCELVFCRFQSIT